jgi:predicted transcriptional regulator of viral defense system
MKLMTEYVLELESSGKYCFTLMDAVKDSGSNQTAVRASLRRLMKKGRVAMPYRSFYVIVPPQYLRLRCLPAEQFIPELMEKRNLDYYVGLLSAASYYGAAHQRPQELQVLVPKALKPLQCGMVKVSFILKSHIRMSHTVKRNTPRGILTVSTPEATAYDLIGYANRCGGYDNVIIVLSELMEQLDGRVIAQISRDQPRAWTQRLGFLLDYLGAKPNVTKALAGEVNALVRDYVALVPSIDSENCKRDSRWKILINTKLETSP